LDEGFGPQNTPRVLSSPRIGLYRLSKAVGKNPSANILVGCSCADVVSAWHAESDRSCPVCPHMWSASACHVCPAGSPVRRSSAPVASAGTRPSGQGAAWIVVVAEPHVLIGPAAPVLSKRQLAHGTDLVD